MLWVFLLSGLLISWFIFVDARGKNYLHSIFFKSLASLSFVMVYGFSIFLKKDELINLGNKEIGFMVFILLGLISGLIGDLLLALRPLQDKSKDKQIIIFGIISFSLGHLFYLTALYQLSKFSILSILLGIIMTLIIYIGSRILKFEMGIAKIPTFFYTFLIFTMVGQTISLSMSQNYTFFSIILMIGALLFAVSDLILAPIYYKNEKRAMFVVCNLTTYYLAQVFIAYSIYLLI